MNKTLNRLADAIAGGDRARGGGAGFLRPIDTDAIAEQLNIASLASENAAANLPVADAVVPDAVEQSIIQKTEAEWRWHGGELINHLRAYATRLIGYSIDAELERLLLRANDGLARLRSAHHTAEQQLGPLRNHYVETRDEFTAFRKKHRISRPTRNPTTRWTAFGLLVLLVAIESVLNGLFFAKGSDFGLLGGVGTAIGISIVNVVAAFLLGLGPARWINHRNWIVKLVGLLLAIGGCVALIGLHGFAAHLRDATATIGEEEAMAAAFQTLSVKPWALAELSSYYLFGLGCLFGLMALWKGYAFDDPYPSYGRQFRRFEKARNAYSDEHSALFDELDEIKDETIRDIDSGIERIPKYPQQAAAIRTQRSALLEQFKNYEGAIETATNQLLTLYRDANRKRRSSSPPAYFSQRWTLPRTWLDDSSVREVLADPKEPETNIPDTLEQLSGKSIELLREYESLLKEYPHASRIE